MNNLHKVIQSFGKAKIGVFGDVMLDDFTYGSINRISPEAPVPVLEAEFTEYRLGGCGNVAANISALGGDVYLFAVVGEDAQSEILRKLLKEQNIHDMTIKDKTRPTTRKNRIISNKQQVGRVDWEKRHDISADIEHDVLLSAERKIMDLDIIILSDYGKGFLTESLCMSLIGKAKRAGKIIIVDPKASFGKYKGATIITPNFKEFEEYGKINVEKLPEKMFHLAKMAMEEHDFSGILVTMGEDGMVLFKNEKYSKVSAIKDGHEIVDVTGAGDTAIGIYALALAAGAGHEDAMRLANYGAGIVVTKLGTATCTQEELGAMIDSDDGFEEVLL